LEALWIGGLVVSFLLAALCWRGYSLYRQEQKQQKSQALRFELEQALSKGKMLLTEVSLPGVSDPGQAWRLQATNWLKKGTDLLQQQFPAVLKDFHDTLPTIIENPAQRDNLIAEVRILLNILENLLKWL
jgi:hypothetical protein